MKPPGKEVSAWSKNAAWFLLPALLVAALIFPAGIQTNLTTDSLSAHEVDPPGPAMQLNDISSGFSRADARRPYSIFPSIALSAIYVPYVWLRSGEMPPYDLAEFAQRHLSLISELIVVARAMNMLAAFGIMIMAFLIILRLTNNVWAVAFVSLSLALNPNLMFQSSITYYENCALLWVFLSVFCYIKLWAHSKRPFLWVSLFSVSAVLAVSTHERMAGYYILSFPVLICRIWVLESTGKGGLRRAASLVLFSGTIGAITFCLANNVFGAGLRAVYEYLMCKSVGMNESGRMNSAWSLLRNQVACHGHAVRLILWNLGFITPLISCLGVWRLWKERHYPGLILLLFPLGYQVTSVGLPGWTAGRYILGQTIFVTLLSGFGVIWFLKNRPGLGKFFIICALIVQSAIIAMVKVSDTYYNPIRVAEKVIVENKVSGKITSVGVRGFARSLAFDQFPETWHKSPDINIKYIKSMDAPLDGYDLVISNSAIPLTEHSGLRGEIIRKPPAWLVRLVKICCYLYSAGPADIYIYSNRLKRAEDLA